MTTVYVSGKITDETEEKVHKNIQLGRRYSLILWHLGFGCFTPHLNTEGFVGIPYEQYMDFDLRILEACDVVFMLPNWKESKGAIREEAYARILGKPIFYNLDEIIDWRDDAVHQKR